MKWPGAERARVRSALALASLLHAAALGTVGGVAVSSRQAASVSSASNADELELLVDVDAQPVTLSAPPAGEPHVARQAVRPRQVPAPSVELADAASQVDAMEEAPAAGAEDGPASDALPPDRVVDLGLGPDAWRTWASVARADPKASADRRRKSRRPFRAPQQAARAACRKDSRRAIASWVSALPDR